MTVGELKREVLVRHLEAWAPAALHRARRATYVHGYADADGGKGVGLVDAMNVALASAFQTADMFTTDSHFRMMRPLTGQPAFRLLPDDL